MMKLSIAIYVVVRNNSLPVLLLGTPNMIKFEGHKCKGHRINTWWTHILNVDIGIIIILVEVFPCSTHTQYTCDLVKWKLSPVASFSILLRMTIHYNYLIMSSKWVLFSSLNTSGKAFQLTVTFITSTSLHSVDREADCKLDSAMYLVPYFFTHWLVWYTWQ